MAEEGGDAAALLSLIFAVWRQEGAEQPWADEVGAVLRSRVLLRRSAGELGVPGQPPEIGAQFCPDSLRTTR